MGLRAHLPLGDKDVVRYSAPGLNNLSARPDPAPRTRSHRGHPKGPDPRGGARRPRGLRRPARRSRGDTALHGPREAEGQVPRLDNNSPRGYPVLGGNLHLVARKRGDPALGENGHKEPDGEPPGPVPDTTGDHAAPEEGAPRRRQKGDARAPKEAVEPRQEHEGEARPR